MFDLRKKVSNNLVNLSGWTTTRKIIVIESDDWGSLRMPNTETYNALLNDGIPVNKSPYCQFDNLCSIQDLEMLFGVLKNHKDSQGNHPMITANVVVANPDFSKIKNAHFSEYYYETIATTFENFFPTANPLNLWKEGYHEQLFFPQFHGREHVNVPFWLNLLKNNDSVFIRAFEHHCWGISTDVYNKYPKSVQASFDYNHESELTFMKESLVDGLDIFENLFGYRSESFTPNNYIWPEQLNEVLSQNGITSMQGMKYQLLPKPIGTVKREKVRRFNGQLLGQNKTLLQMVRNVQFEPSLLSEPEKNGVVNDCLSQIQTAFFWKKPAIISMHRINFCGTLHEENRNENLIKLNQLLIEVKKRWPDVEFLDSVTLSKIIKETP